MREEPKKKVNVMVMAPIRLRFWGKNYLVGYVLEQGHFCVTEQRRQLVILNALSDINQWAWSIGGIILTGAKRSSWRKNTNSGINLAWTGLSSCPDLYTGGQKTNAWAMTRPVEWKRTPEPKPKLVTALAWTSIVWRRRVQNYDNTVAVSHVWACGIQKSKQFNTQLLQETLWLERVRGSREDAGSIPNGVIRIIHLLNPSAALWAWAWLSL
jgi:hypothetical protein